MERRKPKNKKELDSGMKFYSGMENGEPLLPNSLVKTNLKGDEKNIVLLFFLYTLQGIPLGLSAAIPMILQNHGVSYKQQVSLSRFNLHFINCIVLIRRQNSVL